MLGFSMNQLGGIAHIHLDPDKRDKLLADIENGIIRFGNRENFKDLLIRVDSTYTEEMVGSYESRWLTDPKDIGLCVKDPL